MLKAWGYNREGNTIKAAAIGALLGFGTNGFCVLMSVLMGDIKPLPQKVDNLMTGVDKMMGKVDNTFGRVDGLLNEVSLVTSGLSDFMEATEQTLQNADDLMAGVSNMWIVHYILADCLLL